MIELLTLGAALVAAVTGTFLTAAVARNLWAERQQRQLLARMAADQAGEPPAPRMRRRERRALARAQARAAREEREA